MRAIIVIPARYKSSRFPGKPLVKLLGKPMIQWVAELSAKAVGKDNVIIATDDYRIQEMIEGVGFKAVMTSEKCLTGTDRLAEVAARVDADIYINVQGDEPLVNDQDILKIIKAKQENPDMVINGYAPIDIEEDPDSVHIPKVIFNENNEMVYMSRKAIPGFKENKNAPNKYYKQVCIYAFNKEELLSYGRFNRKSQLEKCEDIEILRYLELNHPVLMIPTRPGSLAVDVPEDVAKVEAALQAKING